ncbi:MAG: hypothetical protein ACM3H8_11630 [Sphingobacteriales bacterium]
MKKQIIICLFFFIDYHSWSQLRIITSVPCKDTTILNITGRWVKDRDVIYNETLKFTKEQQQEVNRRIDALHILFQEAYPKAMGADALWRRFMTHSLFGPEYNYIVRANEKPKLEIKKGMTVCSYNYKCEIYPYNCSNTSQKSEAIASYPGETGSYIIIYANELNPLHDRKYSEDTMTINGLPVYMRRPVKEMWKGYEILTDEGGSSTRYVLIHRKGILPYIPVTRKEYLDYCLSSITRFYNKWIADLELYQPDKEQRKEQTDAAIKQKNGELKRFRDELEKTTKANQLDSPAIAFSTTPIIGTPIFQTEAEGGKMLITENPAYIRKDLPKYIPQLFVLYWNWMNDKPSHHFMEMLEANFPIEKLQAMIDK